jgi:hypothetical protein
MENYLCFIRQVTSPAMPIPARDGKTDTGAFWVVWSGTVPEVGVAATIVMVLATGVVIDVAGDVAMVVMIA